MSTRSLRATGSPCSGPSVAPRACISSARAASASARSATSVTIALTFGFTHRYARCRHHIARRYVALFSAGSSSTALGRTTRRWHQVAAARSHTGSRAQSQHGNHTDRLPERPASHHSAPFSVPRAASGTSSLVHLRLKPSGSMKGFGPPPFRAARILCEVVEFPCAPRNTSTGRERIT